MAERTDQEVTTKAQTAALQRHVSQVERQLLSLGVEDGRKENQGPRLLVS